MYLAAILDTYSRYCVGWQLSTTIDTQLTLRVVEMALERRRAAPGWIHHSDRGVQYASTAYIERLRQAKARISMSAKGNPYDNATAESFFKTPKPRRSISTTTARHVTPKRILGSSSSRSTTPSVCIPV